MHDIEGLVYKAAKPSWTSGNRSMHRTATSGFWPNPSRARISSSAVGGRRAEAELLEQMAEKPLIMALANPTPEIMPDLARKARPDAMICTGRSDFPNQVNNVLCFPYIFRGALDCGARTINEEMKLAAVRAIASLAREELRMWLRGPIPVKLRSSAGISHPLALRSAPHPAHRALRRQGGCRNWRCHAPDPGFRRLSR